MQSPSFKLTWKTNKRNFTSNEHVLSEPINWKENYKNIIPRKKKKKQKSVNCRIDATEWDTELVVQSSSWQLKLIKYEAEK